MIDNTTSKYIFIRLSIALLRLVAPFSIVLSSAFVLCTVVPGSPRIFNLNEGRVVAKRVIFGWAVVESLFYLLVFLPRVKRLQEPPTRLSTPLTKSQRSRTFKKSLASAFPKPLLSPPSSSSPSAAHAPAPAPASWFLPSPTHSPSDPSDPPTLTQLKTWLLWALFSTTREQAGEERMKEWEEELQGYVRDVEGVLGRVLLDGDGDVAADEGCMRVTIDPVHALHRPLVWYAIVSLIDTYTILTLLSLGFQHFSPRASSLSLSLPYPFNTTRIQLRIPSWLSSFPPRPLLALPFVSSQAPEGVEIGYWYRPHRHHADTANKAVKPIIFIHGIGIGLYPYIPFLRSLLSSNNNASHLPGILLPELLPISMRMTASPPPVKEEMGRMVGVILEDLERRESKGEGERSEHQNEHEEDDSDSKNGSDSDDENANVNANPGWNSVVLIAHSYGTFIAGWIIRECVESSKSKSNAGADEDTTSTSLSRKIAHAILIDPIPILLSDPSVSYNFVYRHPSVVRRPVDPSSSSPPSSSPSFSSRAHEGEGERTPLLHTTSTSTPTRLSSYPSQLLTHLSQSSASAWQLYYFASRDADVARTLGRSFFWAEGGIWREEVQGFVGGCVGGDGEGADDNVNREGEGGKRRRMGRRRRMGVVIGGRDQIIPSEAIRRYLLGEEVGEEDGDEGKAKGGDGIDVLFFPELDHAIVFERRERMEEVVELVGRYIRE